MYESKSELPETVRYDLPEEAQDLYIEAYNEAWEDYDPEQESGETGRKSVATRVAWATVKRDWVEDEDTGKWYRRGEMPDEDEGDEDEGLLDQLSDMV